MLKVPYQVSVKAGAPALNANVSARKWWWGAKETEKQTALPPTRPPVAHYLPFSRFLRTSFFSSFKEVQKGKLNNPNYRMEKETHFHVNVTILQQNKHRGNNEALV